MFLRVRHRKALCIDKSGACFRGFLRYSRYSSCGCDKLSEASGFYLRGCKVAVLLFCASAFVVSRVVFEFCAAFGILHMCRLMFVLCTLRALLGVRRSCFTPPVLGHCALCPRCAALRFGVLRVASYVVWYRRSVLYVWRLTPHLAPSCEISCEVVCASFDAIAKHPRITCFARVIEHSKTRVWRLALASPCVFCRAFATQRLMRAVKF